LEKRESDPRDKITSDPTVRVPGNPPPETGVRAGLPGAANAPAAADDGRPPDEVGKPTIAQWLAGNAFSLVVLGIGAFYVFWNFDIDGIWAIVKALLGISLVIFIHELGHFLAAKWCDVQVNTFSIGFGPAIPGCWFQWGETVYKLALFPLGGYVQMVGQVDGDEASDGSEDDPRSYRNKTVGQRMLIISAGVIMNVILAFICFILVYQINGKDRRSAVIEVVDSGGPAFQVGLRPGMQFTRINDINNPTFEDLQTSVIFTGEDETVVFVAQRPEDPEPVEVTIKPRLDAGDNKPVIGVGPASRLQLATRRAMGSRSTGPVMKGSAAALAEPPFEHGDEIIATTDPQDPGKVTPLPDDPRNQQTAQRDYFEFYRRMARLADQEVVIRVHRTNGTEADIKVPPAAHYSLGVRMQMGPVAAIRAGSPAAAARIQPPNRDKKLEGDLIEKIEVLDAQGAKVDEISEKTLDPERLPHQLRQWSNRLEQAGKAPMRLKIHLRRHRDAAFAQYKSEALELTWDSGWSYEQVEPLDDKSPLAIPELGLAYGVRPVVAGVLPNLIEDQPLRAGDEIQEMQVTLADGTRPEPFRFKGNFAKVSYVLYQHPDPVKLVTLKVKRDKEVHDIEMVPVRDPSWPLASRGWILMADKRLQKADGMMDAISLGLRDTHRNMMQVVQMLRGIFTGRISPNQLGGPIAIAQTAYRIAGYDIWEFIFFLGLISINLAVINFLPIPVLDGGHMVFLIYEKLRGKPASEAVRVGATYAGLALILSLMVFVIYLDLTRNL
jgi:regulator of sigma E protease